MEREVESTFGEVGSDDGVTLILHALALPVDDRLLHLQRDGALRHNTLDFEKESGAIASLSLGSDRRLIEYVYRLVNESADLTVFSELIATCGTSKPFLLDPCFDTEDAIWMTLTEDSRQQLARAAPGSPDSARPEIKLSMLEHVA